MHEMFYAFYNEGNFYNEGKYSIEPYKVVRIEGDPNRSVQEARVQVLALGQEMWMPFRSKTGAFFNTKEEACSWVLKQARNEAIDLIAKVDRLNQVINKLEADTRAMTDQ